MEMNGVSSHLGVSIRPARVAHKLAASCQTNDLNPQPSLPRLLARLVKDPTQQEAQVGKHGKFALEVETKKLSSALKSDDGATLSTTSSDHASDASSGSISPPRISQDLHDGWDNSPMKVCIGSLQTMEQNVSTGAAGAFAPPPGLSPPPGLAPPPGHFEANATSVAGFIEFDTCNLQGINPVSCLSTVPDAPMMSAVPYAPDAAATLASAAAAAAAVARRNTFETLLAAQASYLGAAAGYYQHFPGPLVAAQSQVRLLTPAQSPPSSIDAAMLHHSTMVESIADCLPAEEAVPMADQLKGCSPLQQLRMQGQQQLEQVKFRQQFQEQLEQKNYDRQRQQHQYLHQLQPESLDQQPQKHQQGPQVQQNRQHAKQHVKHAQQQNDFQDEGGFTCKFVFTGFDPERDGDFELVPRLIGRRGCNMQAVSAACGGKVRIRGRGSGHREHLKDGRGLAEADVPLQISLKCMDHQKLEVGMNQLKEFLDGISAHFDRYCRKQGTRPTPELYTISMDP
eukprot:TRINITY_DN11137_c0_g1_i5.p1 TRINITY_DN11137_c0_g1~~TRINITY_DN11137_c0_g1_i5.p1  ORF type:complete len:511 (-),score=141.25 TRINITY_DN11137_c0_g1_i5:344-1876(-)